MTRSEFIQRAAIEISLRDPSFSPAAVANAVSKATSLADALQASEKAPWSDDPAAYLNTIVTQLSQLARSR